MVQVTSDGNGSGLWGTCVLDLGHDGDCNPWRSGPPVAMCDEPTTKSAAEWGRELLAHEQTIRKRLAEEIKAAAPPAPSPMLSTASIAQQGARSGYFAAAWIVEGHDGTT
jgi:hypothetical protein